MRGLAVLDIGKTNVKLIAFSPDGRILAEMRQPQVAVYRHAGGAGQRRVLDVEHIGAWLEQALASLAAEYPVDGVMISTHGCAIALLDAGLGLAAPILDYEEAIPAEANEAFTTIAPPFSETYSPDLPGGLNFGRTIFFQEWADPELAARTRHLVPYPQYWSLRLSGFDPAALASEISFLGCHSHVWNPLAARFSSLAERRGWAEKFPALKPAGAILAERDGIAIHNGVHDSNAAFYYYKSLGFSDVTLISTGTWVIIFNPSCPLDALDETRDMLANVAVDGTPVATLRFMGGREYDVISQQARTTVTRAMLEGVIAHDQMALPSFAAGGPFPGQAGRIVGPEPADGEALTAIATLYVALMMARGLDLVRSTGDIILDGGLAHNVALCGALAALRPAQRIYRNTAAEGTAMGAAALAFREHGLTSVFTREVEAVAPWAITGLGAYQRRWLERATATPVVA